MALIRPTVSRRRRRAGPPIVAVTGAATGLGLALLERLAGRTDLAALVGVDLSGPPVQQPASVEWRSPEQPGWCAAVDVVVHLAMSYDVAQESTQRHQLNTRGTALVLQAARLAGAERAVVVTSSDVYGAHPAGPVPLPDNAELRAGLDTGLVGDLVEVEWLAEQSHRAGLPVTVLRPAPLVAGALGPAYDGALLRQLAGSRLLALRGVEPLWQVCHGEDLLTALELAVTGAVRGVVPVASDGWLRQSEVEALTSKRRWELPAAVALSTAARLQRLGLTASSPHELDRLLAPIVVDTAVLRAAGWVADWTNERAIEAYLDGASARDSRSAAYTAAGATVALLGTAALMRRAKRQRRR